MKKLLVVFVTMIMMVGVSNAQAFKKESFAANLGLGFGWYSYGYSVSSLPSITLSAEKGVWDVQDVGVISLGGTVGYKRASYDWNYLSYSNKWSWTDFIIAARGTLHPYLIEDEKVDLYGGVALGLRFETWKYYDVVLSGTPNKYTDNNTHPLIGIYAGARYFFSDHFGAFGELGYGLGYLTLGLSYKM